MTVLPPGLKAQASDQGTDDETQQEAPSHADAQIAPEVIVIGRRLDEGVPVVPFTSIGTRNVYGPDQVRESGARDLNDLVQNLPAISTRPYNGGEAAAPSFSMRGLPDDGLTEYVHVLIDGVPASPLPYGWTAFSFMPVTTERIWAIDYLRGAHSVRYSPNTVGGILNFLTPPIPEQPTLEVRTTLGTFDTSSTLVTAGQTKDGFGISATVVDRQGDGYRRDGAWSQEEGNFKVRWDRGEGSWTSTSVSWMSSDHKAPGGLTQAQFDLNPFGNARPENSFTGSRGVIDLVVHEESDDSGWVEGFSYFSETSRHLRAQRPHFGAPATISDWTDDSNFLGLGVRARRDFEVLGGTHSVYGGARFQRDWIDHWILSSEPFSGGASTPTQDARYALDAISLHIDDTFKPTDKLTVTAGFRAETVITAKGNDRLGGFSHEDDFSAVLPGVGAAYSVTDSWVVFANYFEGFRAPQVWGFASATGNDALKFERGKSIELGTRFRTDCGVSGSVAGWRTEYDDFGVFYTGFYENLGNIEAQGVDVEVEWDAGLSVDSLEGFSLAASFTLQNSQLESGPNKGNETPYAWEEKFVCRARFETENEWVYSLGGNYVGDSFSDELNTQVANANGNLGVNPSRFLIDAQVSKTHELENQGLVRFTLGATNLLGKRWYVHSRGGFFGGGLVAGAPRQAYAMMSLSLPL